MPKVSQASLARLSDNKLLSLKIKDLNLSIEGSWLERCIQKLHKELDAAGIAFRPHYWISNEWFSPDGVPGIAVPFSLVHPRLKRLETKMMFEVEGGTVKECMKILRHEYAHALCTAYRLNYRPGWRKAFGNSSKAYPDSYKPKPLSKNYVHHLDWWYAQAHPHEDFAETFAVWLGYPKRWRQQYAGWPALKKLQYVNQMVKEIQGKKPAVKSRRMPDGLKSLNVTLGEHYSERQELYSSDWPDVYDRDLLRLFSNDRKLKRNKPAAQFLRKYRKEIRQAVAKWTQEYEYTIDQVLKAMMERSRDLQLRLDREEREVLRDTILMVTVKTMNFLYRTKHWINL